MNDAAPTPAPAAGVSPVHKRRLRNYLLDARLQLKFTAYMVAVCLSVAIGLGGFLWRTTQTLLGEAEQAVKSRQQAALTSKELGNVTVMNQLAQTSDPEFQEKLLARSKEIDAEYEAEEQAIQKARVELVRRAQLTAVALVGGFAAFILIIAAVGIVVTHRIAGPLFRLKRIANEIAGGQLKKPYALRKGDELGDVFEAFATMVLALRSEREDELKELDLAVDRARAAGDGLLVERLAAMKAKIHAKLD